MEEELWLSVSHGEKSCSYLKTQTRELINMGPDPTVAKQLGAVKEGECVGGVGLNGMFV